MLEYGYSMGSEVLDLAGFRDEKTGNLSRPIPSSHILVPGNIRLDGETLVWEIGTHYRAVKPGPGILEGFLSLQKVPPMAILRYARRWGVLVLDDHGQPCNQWRTRGTEPIATWKYFSGRARAVLNIAAAIKVGKIGSVEDWREIAMLDTSADEFERTLGSAPQGLPFRYWKPTEKGARPLKEARHVVEDDLNAWLSVSSQNRFDGRPNFAIEWNRDLAQWQFRIDHHGFLFAALALELTLAAIGARGLYTCSGCGLPYLRLRDAPRRGKANFCEACGRGEALRQAERRRCERIAEARRLQAAGRSIPEITMQLGVRKQATVERWLKGR
jgi:hypothetical protein